jgi:hypothetical protein
MKLTLIDKLRENIRVFESLAQELTERYEKTPAKERQVDDKLKLAAVNSHIVELKQMLTTAKRQDGGD